MKITTSARIVKFDPCNKDKQGILMQQSALKKPHPFKSYESQHGSHFLAHPPNSEVKSPIVDDSWDLIGDGCRFIKLY
uniref:Uncharacterized protein n=1 Tax=Romanomermis culicivorax TaxID=13658 RepID=A0A915HFC7_ROMCU